MARKTPKRRMNVYSNLSHRRRTKKDHAARKKAEYLASLPKHPVKRVVHRMHPKRVAKFWFSKQGAYMLLKFAGVGVLIGVLLVGALFAYYRKDVDKIRASEIAKRVQTTVTKYYDRNDVLLWEDKGDGDYKLVVKGDEIADVMKQATIAIEDKDFYNHKGVSISGLVRAAVNNTQGGGVQGGSTLTQQLVKQVFFADEAQKRGLDGIPRKIKEVILAVEVERMYNKEQILDLYLNESPYGGRRNGVESAAQTYFNKSAKKLTLAEASLLAAIPNQPGLYDPYNTYGNEALIVRQHKVLDSMANQGYITEAQAQKAKKVPILDTIQPEADQYKGIKAPHFVQMVRSELEQKLGKATVGRGGLVVKTTLDYKIQKKLESSMKEMFASSQPLYAGFTNGAGTLEDVKTGQIIAMVGSRSFRYPGYGQDNAATAFIQPGSSIKPLVYAELFQKKPAGQQNFGSGSILTDSRISFPGYTPQNADRGFRGAITIRRSLALSRNIPAIKAMQVSGVQPTLKTIRSMGDKYYCTQGVEKDVGLSSAIGGCGTRMVDHTNAIASLARMGAYMPHSSVLKVTNSSGEVLEEYKKEKKQIVSAQAAYVVNDILGDNVARLGLFGRTITPNLDAAGVKTAIKTGTSDIEGQARDIWTVGYTPSLAMTVWLGNPDVRALLNGNSSIPAQILDPVMAYATQQYQKAGKAKAGEWFSAPAGIQRIGNEVYPSWYNKSQSQTNAKLKFDRVSKKKATSCTPDAAVVEIAVLKVIDPVTKKPAYIAPDGYDANVEDDVHKCGDAKPSVNGISVVGNRITVRVTKGTHSLASLEIRVNRNTVATISVSGSGTYSTRYVFDEDATISATVRDDAYYSDSASQSYTVPSGP
ncbi:MAG TPA: transglycosylase domain-containing protein [Candidatus Saccharibacteria bacterium]|nr:transglycosylase domain-containing protein [Candidatus Saccharibacteria bacterium]